MIVYIVHNTKNAVYPKYDFEPDVYFKIIGVYKEKDKAQSVASRYCASVTEMELNEEV